MLFVFFCFLPNLQQTRRLLRQHQQDRVRGHQATSAHKDPRLATPAPWGTGRTDWAPARSRLQRRPRVPAVRKGRCPERTCRPPAWDTQWGRGWALGWAARALVLRSALILSACCPPPATATLASPGFSVPTCKIGRPSYHFVGLRSGMIAR